VLELFKSYDPMSHPQSLKIGVNRQAGFSMGTGPIGNVLITTCTKTLKHDILISNGKRFTFSRSVARSSSTPIMRLTG
jgi:hypothetical protein